jgi:cell division control protein 6
MSRYLDRIGAGKILIDSEPLSFDWLPNELVGRDEALGDIASMFMGIESPNFSGRAIVIGPVGSGKTAIVRRFSEDLTKHLVDTRRILPVHINCRNHPTTSQVLQRIAHYLDHRHPERGFSPGEIIQSIRRNLQNSGRHMLLVLDEVSVLLLREGDDLLYQLLRIDEGRDETGTLSLILVSQEPMVHLFEAAVKSRFGQSNRIKLKPYEEKGLHAIVEQRSSAACRPGSVRDDAKSRIAGFAAESGDARLAIELLESSIRRAEKKGANEVAPEHVEPSSAHEAGIEPDMADSLNDHQKMTLLALCRRLRREESVTSGDAERLYHVICEEFEQEARGHTSFWGYIKRLEEIGFIHAETSNTPKGRGRTTLIRSASILPAAIEKRLERDLNRMSKG